MKMRDTFSDEVLLIRVHSNSSSLLNLMNTTTPVNVFFSLGALVVGLGVIFGAFGAHALESSLSEDQLQTFQVGVRYQLIHGLALLAVALAGAHWPGTWLYVSGWCFLFGVIVFSGSIYILVLSGMKWLGMITPVGGMAMIIGWFMLAWHVLTQ